VVLPFAAVGPRGQPIKVFGGDNSDTVILENPRVTENFTYTVTDSDVSVSGSPFGGLTYKTVEGVTIMANSGNDTFNISSTASGVPVTVDGGEGDDTVNLGCVRPFSFCSFLRGEPNLGALKSPVIVNGEAGTDRVNLNDQSATADDSYSISSTGVQRKH